MRKMMNKVAGNMKVTTAKAAMLLKDKKGENYVDTAVKILIAVVIGALLLAGLCRCLHQTGGAGKICRKDHHQYVNKSKGSGSLYREILVRCYRYRATYYILIDFCKVVW